jgi:putative transposase
MRDPSKGLAALRKGRWSTQDTYYFITICLTKGQRGLNSNEVFNSTLHILTSAETGLCKTVHAFVHMPDHIHLLIELNTETSLQDFVRLYKGRMSPTLRSHGLSWQKGYFDRRLRANDSVGSVLRYMLMNPYRKNLLTEKDEWPYWFCTNEAEAWISIAQEKNVPLPEWM